MSVFDKVKVSKPTRSVFDLSHDVKGTGNFGNLIPTLMMECMPGDKFNIGCESLLRFQPLIAPVMHRMDVTMHYFFCPTRLVWDNFEKFITNTKLEGGQLPAHPYFELDEGSWAKHELFDYAGIPDPRQGTASCLINPLPFAMYNKIYNEYYRPQDFTEELPYKLVDGQNNPSFFRQVRRRSWMHDYFTSALPWAQKGDPVNIPIGTLEDVPVRVNNPIPPPIANRNWEIDASNPTQGNITATAGGVAANGNINDNELFAETSSLDIGATTINDLRRAFRLQEWLEKAARGGSRYIENILMHFGVKSSDKRLQRPEYITGTKSPVVISEVLNTTGTQELPQGNMAGHAYSVTAGGKGYYFCEEHGFIIGIMSVMPRTAYANGINRTLLSRNDPFDYPWPTFAHIGEQEIRNAEIFAFHPEQEKTFGYIPRYSEYRYMPSRVVGDMRDNLETWHLARIFQDLPPLNDKFLECDPAPLQRIFAVIDGGESQPLIWQVLHKIRAVRPLPKYGTPTF